MARGKTVGILGGMGPEATADLFLKIVKSTPAKKDQEHLRIVIDNNPAIPDRTAYILGKGDDPRPALIETAKNVEKMGASFIAIPCNTAHFFHSDIQAAVSIPVMHIMREVSRLLKGKIERAGILASSGTLKTKLYEDFLKEAGISVVLPQGTDQDEVMDAIYSVKGGDLEKGRVLSLKQGRGLIAAGAEAVIAGCTEIPLVLKDGDLDVPVIDATKVLAEACVRLALEE
ncbi:MAG: aspartate/glutamate racemase family protein [Bacillota bacterium]|jgi:aspartate racemase